MTRLIRYMENGEWKYPTVKDVGDVSELETTSNDLVSAINELYSGGIREGSLDDVINQLIVDSLGIDGDVYRYVANEITNSLTPINSDIEGLTGDIGDINGAIININQNITGMNNDLSGININISGMDNEISGINGDISGINGDITGINNDIDGINNNITGINNNIDGINENVGDINNRIDGLGQDISDVDSKIDSKVAIINTALSGITSDYADVLSEIADINTTIGDNLETVMNNIGEARETISGVASDLAETKADLLDLSTDLRSELSTLEEDISTELENKLEYSQYTNEINALMERVSNSETGLEDIQKNVEDLEDGWRYSINEVSYDNPTGILNLINTSVETLSGQISSKVSQTSYDTLNRTVAEMGTVVSQTAEDITLKASSSVVEALAGRVEQNELDISANARGLQAKVSQETYDALEERVDSAEGTLSFTVEEVSTMLKKSEYEKLAIGGKNLIAKSSCQDMLPTLAYNDSYYVNLLTTSFDNVSKSLILTAIASASTDRYYQFGNTSTTDEQGFENSKDYVFSFETFINTDGVIPKFQAVYHNGTSYVKDEYEIDEEDVVYESWKRYHFIFDFPTTANGKFIRLVFPTSTTNDSLKIRRVKFEKGNIPTDWTKAEEDVESDIITLTENLEQSQSVIEQLDESITFKVWQTDIDRTVKNAIDEVQIGGANLSPMDKWLAYSSTQVAREGRELNIVSSGVSNQGIYHYEASKYEADKDYTLTFKASLVSGTVTSIGGHVTMFNDTTAITKVFVDDVQIENATWANGINFTPTVGRTYKFEVRLMSKADYSSVSQKGIFIQPNRKSYGTAYNLKVWDLMIEQGNKATNYKPAIEDIEGSIHTVNERVETVEGDIVNLGEEIELRVTTESYEIDKSTMAERIGATESSIEILGESIGLKVDSTSVYTKLEIDGQMEDKAEVSDVEDIQSTLSDMSSDMKITPIEKITLKDTWEKIQIDYESAIENATATDNTISTTNLTTAYNNLNSVTPKIQTEVLSNANTTYTFGNSSLRDVFKNKITAFYTELANVNNLISSKLKGKVDDVLEYAEDTQRQLDNLEVGGRNFILNSDFVNQSESPYINWDESLNGGKVYATDWSNGYNGGVASPTSGYHAHIDNTSFEYPTLAFIDRNSSIGQTHRWQGLSQNFDVNGSLYEYIEIGKTYTLSFEVFSDTVGMFLKAGIYHGVTNQTGKDFYGLLWNLDSAESTNKWLKKKVTFTIDEFWDVGQMATLYIYGHHSSTEGSQWVRNVQLEEGSVASNWKPAVEDVKGSIYEVGAFSSEAHTLATESKEAIDDMSSDMKITPVEKTALKTEWNRIKSEYTQVLSNAMSNGINVSTTNLTNAYTNLNGTTPRIETEILAEMDSTYTFESEELRDNFQTKVNTYFTELEKVRKAINDKLNTNTNALEETVSRNYNTLTSMISSHSSSIEILDREINLKVATAELEREVKRLQVGGINLLRYTKNFASGWAEYQNMADIVAVEDENYDYALLCTTDNLTIDRNPAVKNTIHTLVEEGETYTFSMYIKRETNGVATMLLKFIDSNGNESNPINGISSTLNAGTWYRYVQTFTIPTGVTSMYVTPRISTNQASKKFWIAKPKLESGNKATEWSPSPLDLDSEIVSVKESLVSHDSRIELLEEGIELKASSSEVNTSITNSLNIAKSEINANITSSVNSAKSELNQNITTNVNTAKSELNQNIASSVNNAKSELNQNIASSVNNAKSELNQNITSSVNNAVDEMTEDLNTAKGELNQNITNAVNDAKGEMTEDLNSAVGDIESTIADIEVEIADYDAQLSVMNQAITAKVSSVQLQTAIDGVQFGGTNLILNSSFIDDFDDWNNNGGWTIVENESDEETSTSGIIKVAQTGKTSNNIISIYSSKRSAKVGDSFTFSLYFKVTDATAWDVKIPFIAEFFNESSERVEYKDVALSDTNLADTTIENDVWYRCVYNHTVLNENVAQFDIRPTLFRNGEIFVKEIQVEKGNKATEWSPSPLDFVSKLSKINVRLNNAEEVMTDDAIVSKVTSSVSFTNLLDSKATADAISDLASKTDLDDMQDDIEEAIKSAIENLDLDAMYTRVSEVEKKADSVTTKIKATGGINLVYNSIGYAGFDMWTPVNSVYIESVKNAELESMGYGSGFYFKPNDNVMRKHIVQNINLVVGMPYTFSWMLNKNNNADDSEGRIAIQILDTSDIQIGEYWYQGTDTTNGFESQSFTFTATESTAKVRIFGYALSDFVITAINVNIGDEPLQWSMGRGELYNTNVVMNLNGIRVESNLYKGHTIMSPQEFSGYVEVLDEETNTIEMERVFTLNKDTTEVSKLSARKEIDMKPVQIIPIRSEAYKGWAFVPSLEDD